MMKSLQERFSGVFTALVTPFDEAGNLDLEAFESLVQHQLDAGVSGLVPVGTTGEAATLNEQERNQIIQRTIELSAGRAFVRGQKPCQAEYLHHLLCILAFLMQAKNNPVL